MVNIAPDNEFGLFWILMSMQHDPCSWNRSRLDALFAQLPKRG